MNSPDNHVRLSVMKFFSIVLMTLFIQQANAMNSFTIYAFKSSVGVNWKSPKALAKSIVKNEALKYFNGNSRLLGHVSIKLQCGERKLVTAMTSRAGETKRVVLKKHAGLGVLFHIFPGELESAEKLNREIAIKRRRGQVHSITYLISDEACNKMFNHYDNFIDKLGMYNYGFPVDTLAGEGGGCSAFGVSFLQAAGIAQEKQLKAWSGSVWVPSKYIGPYSSKKYIDNNPNPYDHNEGGENVKLIPLILKPGKTAWAKPNEPGARFLSFFDPDTMFQWVKRLDKEWNRNSNYQKRKFNKSIDLIFDYRNY